MAALRTVVAHLQRSRGAECALYIEQILHAISRRQDMIGAPGKAERNSDRKRGGVNKVLISDGRRPVSGLRHLPCASSQSTIQIENGVLTLLRVEDAETGADSPFIRGAPRQT